MRSSTGTARSSRWRFSMSPKGSKPPEGLLRQSWELHLGFDTRVPNSKGNFGVKRFGTARKIEHDKNICIAMKNRNTKCKTESCPKMFLKKTFDQNQVIRSVLCMFHSHLRVAALHNTGDRCGFTTGTFALRDQESPTSCPKGIHLVVGSPF